MTHIFKPAIWKFETGDYKEPVNYNQGEFFARYYIVSVLIFH